MNDHITTPAKALDMTKAWDTALGMLKANREIALVLAGVFIFLPILAVSLGLETGELESLAQNEASPEKLMEAVTAHITQYWWVYVVTSIVQTVGTIALYRVLAHYDRPTVADAMKAGLSLILVALAAQILSTFAALALPALAFLIGGPVGAIIGLIAFPVMFYVVIKLAMVTPVIALETERNPLGALNRSWQISRGNSLRMAGFFALLILAGTVLYFIASLVVGIVLALIGPAAATIGNAIFGAAFNTVGSVLACAVLAAIYKQFVRPTAPIRDTGSE